MRQVTITDLLSLEGVWWALRLTDDGSVLDMDKTQQITTKYDKWIISEEGDGDHTRLHHHIIISTKQDIKRDTIRQHIKEVYPTLKGNKSIYIQPCKDKKQLTKYTLKEGQYKYNGFSKDFIKNMERCASPKTDLKKNIQDIEDQYILGQLDDKEFLSKYIQLKALHDQPLYLNHIQAYMTKQMTKKNPGLSNLIADTILFRINLEN